MTDKAEVWKVLNDASAAVDFAGLIHTSLRKNAFGIHFTFTCSRLAKPVLTRSPRHPGHSTKRWTPVDLLFCFPPHTVIGHMGRQPSGPIFWSNHFFIGARTERIAFSRADLGAYERERLT